MLKLPVICLLSTFSSFVQSTPPATVPESLRVPAGQTLLFHFHGSGDQIYSCQAADNQYTWKLKAPDAKLLGEDGQVAGRHFAGPTWEGKDGSSVVGKAAANAPSPDASSVPWLLLNAVKHEGAGSMNGVLTIQRLDTKGGKAPGSGCDAAHSGQELRVPYTAEYYFYGTTK